MDSLRDHFLLAMPGLRDNNFSHTLTYICEHNADGALGIVINQPLNLTLADLLLNLTDDPESGADAPDLTVMFGGPVQEDRGFILHTPGDEWEHNLHVSSHVALSTSREVLLAIAHRRGPRNSLIALGYAGWGAGQLEAEMASNSWLSSPADSDIIYHVPSDQRLEAAARSLGIDYRLLSADSGHA